MSDATLERIAFKPAVEESTAKLKPIPWPEGLEPVRYEAVSIPKAEVLVVTYTAAEGQALADVLTPGFGSHEWPAYTDDWKAYESQLTDRSPAREAKCLGYFATVMVGETRVVLFKSELHPSTDAKSLPMWQLWKQLIAAIDPELVITTGTAGGVGAATWLGDVLIAKQVRWDCQKQFKEEVWAGESYACSQVAQNSAAAELMQVNAARLQPESRNEPAILAGGDVLTTDFFAFDDSENTYGLRTLDSDTDMVEMDDAACGLAIQDLRTAAPRWVSIRNASDPQIPEGKTVEAEDKLAASIYQKYGYWTTVCSAIVCWGVIAAL